MRKIVTALAAAGFVAAAAIGTSGAANARPWGWHGGGWGPGPFVGGLVAGAVVGSALAAPYYPYGYYPYGPYPYRPCAWRTVWNGYRWVRVCY
jgi:hypothetical protein